MPEGKNSWSKVSGLFEWCIILIVQHIDIISQASEELFSFILNISMAFHDSTSIFCHLKSKTKKTNSKLAELRAELNLKLKSNQFYRNRTVCVVHMQPDGVVDGADDWETAEAESQNLSLSGFRVAAGAPQLKVNY